MNRMKNRLTAWLLSLAVMACVLAGSAISSYAATGQLTFSDPTAAVGDQVSVTMKITTADGSLGAADVMVGYDASALEFVSGTNANGGAGQIRLVGSMETTDQKTFSFTLKFKALKAGTSSLTVSSQEVYDADSKAVTLSHVGSSTVTVSAASSSSTDASLSGLTISPGSLSPAFSAGVTEYTATVAAESIAVSAEANDSKATVSVSGNEGLQMGENTVVCTVTAEDGTTKTYTITVTRVEEGAEIPETDAEPVTVDTGNWTVEETFDASLLPAGFTATEIEYNGVTVQAGTDENGFVILYMTDENGESDFFFYDVENHTTTPYVTVLMAEKTIIVLPASAVPADLEIPEGFNECTIDIGTHTVNGWIWGDGSETPEYCVVYGMNESGERNLYRYDQKEMTLQRYFQDPDAADTKAKLSTLADEYNSLVDDFNTRGIIIAVLFGICLVLVILLIILLLTRKPKNDVRRAERVKPYESDREDSRRGRGAGAGTVRKSGRNDEDTCEPDDSDDADDDSASVRRGSAARRGLVDYTEPGAGRARRTSEKQPEKGKAAPAPDELEVVDLDEEEDDDLEVIDLDL